MSAWTNGTYTRKGLALLAKLTQGSSLKITRGVSGTGYVKPEVLADQTAVIGVKQELSFKAASYPEAGTCKLPVFLTNNGLAAGYKAKQIGLYAVDPDEGEILYFIAQSQTGTDVPGAAEMPDYSATWTFYFHYGQADNVSVTVDPSHTITEDMLNEVRIIAERGVSVAKEGTVVRNDNAAALPFAGLRLFGKTTQNGTPTPDAPVELVSIENPEIGVAGKNLLPIGTVTFEVTKSYDPELPIPAGEYWLSCHTESTDTDGDNSTIVFLNNGQNVLYLPMKRGDVSRKITLKDSVDRVQLCAAYNNTQGVGDTATWANVQLERSDKFTGYEAYKEPQAAFLNYELRGIPVASGGNYTDENGQQWVCDEVDFARGVFVRRVKTETVSLQYDAAYERYIGQVSDFAASKFAVGSGIPLVSNILPFNPNASSTSNGTRISSSGTKMLIACYNGKVLTSATVAYPIETPIETALTDAELAAYAALTANNPTTTVVNDAGAWMEVDLIEAQHEKGLKAVAEAPVMEVGTAYRTAEWWCGKPVLTKVFHFESDVDAGLTIDTGLDSSIYAIIDSRGVAASGVARELLTPNGKSPFGTAYGIIGGTEQGSKWLISMTNELGTGPDNGYVQIWYAAWPDIG